MRIKPGSGKITSDGISQLKRFFPESEEILYACGSENIGTKKYLAVSQNLIKVFNGTGRFARPTQEFKKSELEFAFFSAGGEKQWGSIVFKTKNGQRKTFDFIAEADALEVLKIIDITAAEEMTANKELRGKLLAEVAGFGLTGGGVKVFEGEVHVNGSVRPIDITTVAEVVSNGQVLITTRPTLTRMALLAPLPGSALIPGLALAKKQSHDNRVTEIVVEGQNWHATARVDPADVGKATAVANRINAIANASPNTPMPGLQPSQIVESQVNPNNQKSLSDELSSLNDLFQSGVLSEEEFNSAKAKILGA